ncbi:MAG: ribonuclease HI family protein [Candidatus Brocadiae bacterium]|nr:ribonuclease HI family protein [Candidatus Brocadiia bacterium]
MPHLIIHVDGASRGNPGPASTGVVFLTPDGVDILTRGEYIGEATNNVAEYRALLDALRRAPQYLSTVAKPELEVRSDSELLVKQLTGVYRIKHPGLQPLAAEAKVLARKFAKVAYRHVRREDNRVADRLCNLALDRRGVVEELD